MGMIQRAMTAAWAGIMIAAMTGCETRTPEPPARDTTRATAEPVDTTAAPAPPADTIAAITDSTALPVTLPLLDAFFADSTFAADLETRLGLSAEEVDSLRTVARAETARLREGTGSDYTGTTTAARQLASDRIRAIVGDEKARTLAGYLRERWKGADSTAAAGGAIGMPSTRGGAGALPTDTRVVVNAPAYRMDLFRDGKLIKSYRVGIGYPEFPLPTGTVRTARSIIFNPTWTPPDEPWVEGSSKVRAGKTIAAGSSLNPLGPIKIPIGLPSLIHGGKQPSRLGTFASHGCVGMTDPQIRSFASELASLSGTDLPDSLTTAYLKKKTETKSVELAKAVPVELRYETIVVEDGVLHIYRDVYDQNTNTEEHLNQVLAAYGVSPDQLTAEERAKADAGLREMSRDALGRIDSSRDSLPANPDTLRAKKAPASGKVTKNIKGAREVAIPIAALSGKGYPAPVEYDPSGMEKKFARGLSLLDAGAALHSAP
jgi:lipoprotein-anchoring transpeptidase ErfK/SrfK